MSQPVPTLLPQNTSSKMGKKRPRGLSFVNITGPEAFAAAANRSLIRAHASRPQNQQSSSLPSPAKKLHVEQTVRPAVLVQRLQHARRRSAPMPRSCPELAVAAAAAAAPDNQQQQWAWQSPDIRIAGLREPVFDPIGILASPAGEEFAQHFLGYFAEGGADRQQLKTQLWPLVLSDSTLYYATLFLAACHRNIVESVDCFVLDCVRTQAFSAVHGKLASHDGLQPLSEQALIAATILASCEFCYDVRHSTFRAHMARLKKIVESQGGVAVQSEIVRKFLLSAGVDLALFVSTDPYFEHAFTQTPPPKIHGLPQGYVLPLGFKGLLENGLFRNEFVGVLKTLSLFAIPSVATNEGIREAMEKWLVQQVELEFALPYSPFQSAADDKVILHAHLVLRLGCLCFCHVLKQDSGSTKLSSGDDTRGEGIRDSMSGIEEVEESATRAVASIDIEMLQNTIFAELLLWCLFVYVSIFPAQPDPSKRHAIAQVIKNLEIQTWPQAQRLLGYFLYTNCGFLDEQCGLVWKTLRASYGVQQAPAVTEGVVSPTTKIRSRFDRDVANKAFPGLPSLLL